MRDVFGFLDPKHRQVSDCPDLRLANKIKSGNRDVQLIRHDRTQKEYRFDAVHRGPQRIHIE